MFSILLSTFLATPSPEPIDTGRVEVKSVVALSTVEIQGVRAQSKTPLTFTFLDQKTIQVENSGRDIPFVLQWVPGMVQSSDAGTGLGYTYLRLRGSDQTRINVTLNGVPLNDPESHGVFWVNTPDISSSLQSIQVQRGVGTSTVGVGAFGGSISLETAEPKDHPHQSIQLMAGTPTSSRLQYAWETGRVGAAKRWAFHGRLSTLQSRGYVQRSALELYSLSLGAKYVLPQASLRVVYLDGQETTQQAWYGIPEAKYNGDSAGIEAYIQRNYLDSNEAFHLRYAPERQYNFYTYPNEIDHYRQRHFQIHYQRAFGPHWKVQISPFLVLGRGYFEQFRKNDPYADYGLPHAIVGDDTLTSTSLVRRRWLDNVLSGTNAVAQYRRDDWAAFVGIHYMGYAGLHFGTLAWMNHATGPYLTSLYEYPIEGGRPYAHRYYQTVGDKWEGAAFGRMEWPLGSWRGYADVQWRYVSYLFDYDALPENGQFSRHFFNPKAGISRTWNNGGLAYASIARAHREPIRADFLESPIGERPSPEALTDIEIGYRRKTARGQGEINVYAMEYTDQLVPTGALNDVGAALRANVDKSYRRGVEMDGLLTFTERWSAGGNIAWSHNRIAHFQEILYDYGTTPATVVTIDHYQTPIALSPGSVGHARIVYTSLKGSVSLFCKSVGRQYLDNTGSLERSLDPYTTVDVRWQRQTKTGTWQVDALNILRKAYVPNGYTWGYLYQGQRTSENFYYPMALAQLMVTYRWDLESVAEAK